MSFKIRVKDRVTRGKRCCLSHLHPKPKSNWRKHCWWRGTAWQQWC